MNQVTNLLVVLFALDGIQRCAFKNLVPIRKDAEQNIATVALLEVFETLVVLGRQLIAFVLLVTFDEV